MNEMTNIQIGSLVLNTELLIYLAAGVVAVFALQLRSKGHPLKDKIVSIGWNAVILWIVVWKGSLLLFDPMSVIRNPLSLLFFSGGAGGFWLATLSAAGLSWYSYRKIGSRAEMWKWMGILLTWWSAPYLLIVIVFGESVVFLHYIGFLLAVGAGMLLLRPIWWSRINKSWSEGKLRDPRFATQVAVLLLVLGLLSYTLYDQTQNGVLSNQTSNGGVGEAVVGAREGMTAPSFELVDWEGEKVSLDDYRGQTVMINFWTTWCKVCKTEMPHVEKLFAHYESAGGDVAIVTVNVTSQEQSAKHVRQYVEGKKFKFPVLLDERGDTASQYVVNAYPTTFILDGNGIIRERFLGAISYHDMKKRIDRVVKEK
ncbi:TlpA disulfide reductase family protein [Paenibacillus sp. L3-i20]|uniref:TlpA family protein disulfide reductase n=1 Tax=Paenibacillus sp. L3-i20 TaxID=2905833 RepID=UPI001EE11901|nr:TlpA disulfide reductase family protein [Paenibacillus sp. L3-i20]GKU77521.1 hypothetical protein L3i20_v219180 [Paenibacillus sp. L3-i20]